MPYNTRSSDTKVDGQLVGGAVCVGGGGGEGVCVGILVVVNINLRSSLRSSPPGFERLFEHMESYILDVPSAHSYVISFLARAVVDEVLPPSFLSDPLVRSIGGGVVEDAMRLLSREHYGVRLERVWGPGDGRPVAELKVAMDQLLKEFLLSNELDEAAACVKVRIRARRGFNQRYSRRAATRE